MTQVEGRLRKGPVLQVLKYETERQPGSLGSSVLGYNDAFAKLHPVLRQWRAKRAASPAGAVPVPYLVSADVSRAFDNVDADRIIGIVEPMLCSQQYLIIKHMEVKHASLAAHLQRHSVSLPCGLISTCQALLQSASCWTGTLHGLASACLWVKTPSGRCTASTLSPPLLWVQ